jgi:hypothetical protein
VNGSTAERVCPITSLVRCIACISCVSFACGGGVLDAGSDTPHGLLPIDERNPILLCNDGASDNWQGEYALLFANSGSKLAGIIINDSPAWPNIDANIAGWRAMVAAARASGMQNAPDPLASIGPPLVRPGNGDIDSTQPNRSEGARFIVDAAQRLSLPYRPLVVATGGRLTDVADAYLLDHSLPDRLVVVSSLGTAAPGGGTMGVPNGEMDPWADTIVVQRFRYVQVSAYYDQTTDVPSSLLSELPNNAFGAWIASKRASILNVLVAADQVSVVASALPPFVLEVAHVSQNGSASLPLGEAPTLGLDAGGHSWLVTRSAGALATARLWQLLLDGKTYLGK